MDSSPIFLKRYRYWIMLLLIAAPLVNALVRFSAGAPIVWTSLFGQALFGQAIFAYVRGARIVFGGATIGKDDHPFIRAGGAAFALVIYLLFFAYDGDKREESIYERRPSDWTMPTWEEFRR